jgi:hypothetical protein
MVVVFQMQEKAVSQAVGLDVAVGEEVGVDKYALELVQLLTSPTATAMPMARLPRRVMPILQTARRLTDRIKNTRHDSWRIDVTSRKGLVQNGVDSCMR